LTKYKGKQREAVERAINSGVLNNTNRSHELVNVLAKIEADKGIVFDYTNNERLKESGFAIEGKTINGIEDKGKITLNMESHKAWESVVGHEITHVLQGTDAYEPLKSALFEYAKSKGELETRREALTELYKGIETDIDKELTADLVGDYLFTDSKFIKHLTSDRNVFQKVYDEVKYLWKTATGKEKAQIEKVKREFDKAWKELGKVTPTTESVIDTDTTLTDTNLDDTTLDESAIAPETTIAESTDVEEAPKGSHIDDAKIEAAVLKSLGIDITDEEGNVIHSAKKPDAETDAKPSDKGGVLFDATKKNTDAKYSISEDSNSSFKQKQLEIIQETNPAYSDSFTWIRKVEDIHTLEETLSLSDWAEYDEFDPDLTKEDVLKAIESGEITVYSSHPIENGAFVTPSRMEAETYAGEGKVYEKTVDIKDVAWIDPTQGQYAKVKADAKHSQDSNGNELPLAVQKRFANSKAVDENGNLKVLYHGTASGEFYTFDKSKGSVEGDFGSGFYFTDSESDVEANYEDGGADFEKKVARRA
jgi:hypothetical protein